MYEFHFCLVIAKRFPLKRITVGKQEASHEIRENSFEGPNLVGDRCWQLRAVLAKKCAPLNAYWGALVSFDVDWMNY